MLTNVALLRRTSDSHRKNLYFTGLCVGYIVWKTLKVFHPNAHWCNLVTDGRFGTKDNHELKNSIVHRPASEPEIR